MSAALDAAVRAGAAATAPLLEVRDLNVHFPVGSGWGRGRAVVHAVDGVSFTISRGETLALVGESGCGKSTMGRAILQLTPADGEILLDGVDLCRLDGEPLRQVRRRVQMVFQDPQSSLNPRKTIFQILAEPLHIHGIGRPGPERRERVEALLRSVGFPAGAADRYPHEFSGGQRQRIGIARALAAEPSLIVLDEPVSALDVSIRSQIVNLLQDLQERLGLTYLFITHELTIARHVSDRIAVMYLGKLVELVDRDELSRHALHPYTKALLSAVPLPDPKLERSRRRIVLVGDVPSPLAPPTGCRFHSRCPWARPECAAMEPALRAVADGHLVACHYWDRLEEAPRPA